MLAAHGIGQRERMTMAEEKVKKHRRVVQVVGKLRVILEGKKAHNEITLYTKELNIEEQGFLNGYGKALDDVITLLDEIAPWDS